MGKLPPGQDLKDTVGHRDAEGDGHHHTHQGLTKATAKPRPVKPQGTIEDHHRNGKGQRRWHHRSNERPIYLALQHERHNHSDEQEHRIDDHLQDGV